MYDKRKVCSYYFQYIYIAGSIVPINTQPIVKSEKLNKQILENNKSVL